MNIEQILYLILSPLARFCLKRGVDIRTFSEVAKHAFLNAALEDLGESNASMSRLYVRTGIDRRIIKQFMREKDSRKPTKNLNIRSRAITLWEQGKRYQDKNGEARPLSYNGAKSEFHVLCSQITQSINPSAILAELEQSGAVRREGDRLVLVRHNPSAASNSREGYEQLAKDLDTLLTAGTRNLEQADQIAHLHIRTEFDNIYVEDISKIKVWLLEQGKDLHRRARTFLAECDKDLSQRMDSAAPSGGRVSLLTASFATQEPGVIKRE